MLIPVQLSKPVICGNRPRDGHAYYKLYTVQCTLYTQLANAFDTSR